MPWTISSRNKTTVVTPTTKAENVTGALQEGRRRANAGERDVTVKAPDGSSYSRR